ncbi:MAG TPA: hypothetical protein VFQ35_28470, partial [Polyangiaceae bacterium]|nr:hypothetical protein [Polyangiaceae bacterium]
MNNSHVVRIGSNTPNDSAIAAATPGQVSSLLTAGNFGSFSPETAMVYLKSRLDYLDQQIQDVFNREQLGQHVRSEVHAIQMILSQAEVSGADPKATGTLSADAVAQINDHLEEISHYDLNLANELKQKLYGDGQVLRNAPDGTSPNLASPRDYRPGGTPPDAEQDQPPPP